METISITTVESYADTFINVLIDYSPAVISAVLILVIGLWVISMLKKVTHNILTKKKLDATLVNFLSDLMTWALKALLFVTVISRLGIETSSFVAILGAAGLAIGLALQGSLANFAGGVLIILFKPFKVNDVIEAQGVIGKVKEIQIFVTQLSTADNQTIFVPNGALSNGNITNYTLSGTRRVDLVIGVSYSSNIKNAKEIALDVMMNHPLVLKDPAPSVSVLALADSSINLGVRPWSKSEDYWTVYSDILEQCKNAYDAEGIEIPFPQRDVHIKNN